LPRHGDVAGHGSVRILARTHPYSLVEAIRSPGATPQACFPGDGTTVCRTYGSLENGQFGAKLPANSVPLDPQIGWEQQKFLIAWTMLYLPENQQQDWLDMMRIWELGVDSDPGISPRIEFHNPMGKVYVARSYGKEEIFGQVVEKGIAGRVLEYANSILKDAYVTKDGPDANGDDVPDWYLPVVNPVNGQALVKFDPTVKSLTGEPVVGCDATDNSKCTCEHSKACVKLKQYVEVPFFLREAVHAYGLGLPKKKGVY